MKRSISTYLAIWIVRFYQKFISPYKGFNCPYGKLVLGAQSCSGYGMTALQSMPFSEAIKAIKARLHCCHEVNVLFNNTCTSKRWGPYRAQGGFVDGDCGGGDCGSGPDCGDCGTGDCGDCSGPSCDDCSILDCGMFSSGSSGSSSASSDLVEFFLDVADDGVEAVVNGVKSIKNNTTAQQAAAAGVGAAIVANQLLKKKFILVAKLNNNKSIYRIDKETGCYLVDTDKAKEQLRTPKEFYVTEDEAKEIISNN